MYSPFWLFQTCTNPTHINLGSPVEKYRGNFQLFRKCRWGAPSNCITTGTTDGGYTVYMFYRTHSVQLWYSPKFVPCKCVQMQASVGSWWTKLTWLLRIWSSLVIAQDCSSWTRALGNRRWCCERSRPHWHCATLSLRRRGWWLWTRYARWWKP